MTARFFAPDTAFAEARKHLPEILKKRNINPETAMAVLEELLELAGCFEVEIYGRFEKWRVSPRNRLGTGISNMD
jgi:predicted nucleic acid-binding protein